MRSIKGEHRGQTITLPVAVLKSDNSQDLSFITAKALLDTGASSSGLAPNIISSLSLRSIGKNNLVVATELRSVDYYLFRIGLFQDKFGDSQYDEFPFIFAETTSFKITHKENFDMVLGMDVLSQCDFDMKRNGSWKLIFG